MDESYDSAIEKRRPLVGAYPASYPYPPANPPTVNGGVANETPAFDAFKRQDHLTSALNERIMALLIRLEGSVLRPAYPTDGAGQANAAPKPSLSTMTQLVIQTNERLEKMIMAVEDVLSRLEV